MEKRCDDEIKRKDMKIILELDGKVMEQQSTLEKAGVPGFFVTNKPHEIRLQMYLLDFLYKLSKTDVPVTWYLSRGWNLFWYVIQAHWMRTICPDLSELCADKRNMYIWLYNSFKKEMPEAWWPVRPNTVINLGQ